MKALMTIVGALLIFGICLFLLGKSEYDNWEDGNWEEDDGK